MFVLKMYVQIMSLSVLLCNVCVCYVYILKMSKKKKKFKVKGHQQWYAVHCLKVVYLHAKYEKPVLKSLI